MKFTGGNDKYTDPVAITLKDSGVHVFTSKPDKVQPDGYCYKAGDLWVVGSDYRPQQKELGLTYRWFIKNADSKRFSTSGVTANSYNLTMSSSNAGRKVFCIATDVYGNKAVSNIATLNLVGEDNPPSLTIKQNIVDQQVGKGENVSVTFDVEGTGVNYAWFYMNADADTFSTSDITGNTYATTMVSTRAGRKIYCIATDANGNCAISNIVTLNMVGVNVDSDLIIQQNITDQEAQADAVARVEFDVVGKTHAQNTILVCTTGSASYSDYHWVESAYYSTAFEDLKDRTDKLEQHVIIDPDGLHLRAFSQNDITFESLLTSEELSFGTWSNNQHNKVVWLGTDDMSARNVTVENYLNITAKNTTQPYLTLGGFIFQVEHDGSLSIL